MTLEEYCISDAQLVVRMYDWHAFLCAVAGWDYDFAEDAR